MSITTYEKSIRELKNPTFSKIRQIATNELSFYSHADRDSLFNSLKRGTALLKTHDQQCQYLYSYGNMHKNKVDVSLSHISPNVFKNKSIQIIDWGCGQGLATICFFDYIKENNITCTIKKAVLIEPASSTLDRAKLHVEQYIDSNRISVLPKFFNELNDSDIESNADITLHFFSNILDVEEVDIRDLAQRISKVIQGEHYLVCIGPLNSNNRRIDSFYDWFISPELIWEEEHNKDYHRYTAKYKLFKIERFNNQPILVSYNPAVQFHAAMVLDGVRNALNDKAEYAAVLLKNLAAFEVATPFDIGASIYEDVNPILAVLNNIIVRGLPTKASPFIEKAFCTLGNHECQSKLGGIEFDLSDINNEDCFLALHALDKEHSSNEDYLGSTETDYLVLVNEASKKSHTDEWIKLLQLTLSPIAIARIEKTIIEALITRKLDINLPQWNILVEENDVPCAALAFADFKNTFNNLCELAEDCGLQFPHINLTIISSEEFYDSPLHNTKDDGIYVTVVKSASEAIKAREYDMVIDSAIMRRSEPEINVFSNYKCNNQCYFIIRSAHYIRTARNIYTSDVINYKPLVTKDNQGLFHPIKECESNIQYFLQLLFRKQSFRPGQLPILSRALQNKSVIGLLPTGGGKSLTYQLAGMLQPGVTVVVDPLRSLMKDQYDGLLKVGIDSCTFINSSISGKEKEDRAQMMEKSQLQFIFLSPERLCIYAFREKLRNMHELGVYFSYGVIDEVHCVSEWGHDFRFTYLHLGRNLYNYVLPKQTENRKHLTLFGLTATASFDVLADVERELSGSNAYSLDDDALIRYENTNRLELQYNVFVVNVPDEIKVKEVDTFKEGKLRNAINDAINKIIEIQEDEPIRKIKSRFIERESLIDENITTSINNANLNVNVETGWEHALHSNTAGIIFCLRANREENVYANNSVPTVANKLRNDGISSISTYKGGDDTTSQDDFLQGNTNIMVATKAFGMGIDKSNVRFTFHLNYPSSLESFVQEAGRAGRDRKMALATIMYCPKKFWAKNVKTNEWQQFTADYINNKFFYDSNFLGEEFELYMMELLMKKIAVKFSDEEFIGIEQPTIADCNGIIELIAKYEIGKILTYYVSYEEDEQILDNYNQHLFSKLMPIFNTRNAQRMRNKNGYNYIRDYGKAIYKDAIQKAIYRMCIIGLIDDFTEDYTKKTFRITTICQDSSKYYDYLRIYYRKYYSIERTDNMIEEVRNIAKTEGVIMACLKHLTSFIYRNIANKRARAILDMEQFCNMAVSSKQNWKETNENLKDYIYYYFNSKYAREGFISFDSKNKIEIPFSLKDDTNHETKSEYEIKDFEIVRKYMRVVDSEIVNNDSQMDNIKHLQGAVRLIRRSLTDSNPAIDFLNVFCSLFLGLNNNKSLFKETKASYLRGYNGYYEFYNDKEKFYLMIEDYKQELFARNISEDQIRLIEEWTLEAEVEIQNTWLNTFKQRYLN